MKQVLYYYTFSTPLGTMQATSNNEALLTLEFTDQKNSSLPNIGVEHKSAPIQAIMQEMELYFTGKLKEFKTPIEFSGTPFQSIVWQELLKIPYGKTISYTEQAEKIARPTALRAVANTNSRNKLTIIVPCHRVIGKKGTLTGYAGGLERKEFLLNLERNHS